MSETNLTKVLENFDFKFEAKEYGNGHINRTYVVGPKYILQKINTDIFKDPDGLMENITAVTEFLKEKIIADGGNPLKETLTVIPTKDGKNYFKDSDGGCYRCYEFIMDSLTLENADSANDLYEAARGFALFQKRLSDFPADKLHETIVDFHNTPVRYKALEEAVKNDIAGRASSVGEEIDFALGQADWIDCVVNGLSDGTIPLRVTHNDTKINNIMFDINTRKSMCVIDLDTVMPGSLLYDFGDALRIGAATGAEDEINLDKITFNLEYFEAFVKGFADEMKDALTKREIELLATSAMLLTYECGIRFLADYLNGDTYFRIHREHHNLDRCRTQFKLVKDMMEKKEKMEDIVKKYFA